MALIGLVSCFAASLEALTAPAMVATWLLVPLDLFLAERGQRRFPRATLGMLLMLVTAEYACVGPTVSSGSAPPLIWLAARFAPAIDLLPRNQQEGFSEARDQAVAGSGAPADLTAAAVAERYLGLGKGAAPRPDNPQVGYIGLQGEADLSYDIPVPVTVDRERVDGSSWGGMLTLEIISPLTPGGVANGHVVAGTGTIQPDGAIGQIGGLAQKVWMADHAGADVVFVPASQLADAGRLADHIQIVPVARLDQIIAWLKAHPQ
jgi:hypothetical protein